MCIAAAAAWHQAHEQPHPRGEGIGVRGVSLLVVGLCDRLVSVDKSGIFRSLVLFREHHLVHSLEDGDGGIRYEPVLQS